MFNIHLKRTGFCALILVPGIVLLAFLPSTNTKSHSTGDARSTADTSGERNGRVASINREKVETQFVVKPASNVVLSSHVEWNPHYRHSAVEDEPVEEHQRAEEVKNPGKLNLLRSQNSYPATNSEDAFRSGAPREVPVAQDFSQLDSKTHQVQSSLTFKEEFTRTGMTDTAVTDNQTAARLSSTSKVKASIISFRNKGVAVASGNDLSDYPNPLRAPVKKARAPVVIEQSNVSPVIASSMEAKKSRSTQPKPESIPPAVSTEEVPLTATLPPTTDTKRQPEATPQSIEPVQTEPVQTEPVQTEPVQTEQVQAEQLASDTLPTSTQEAPRVAIATKSGEENNSIRNSVAPEAFSYSERKSDPTAVENNWHKSETARQISGTLWWTERAKQPLRTGTVGLPLDLDSLLVRALQHSAQIQVFTELPLIRDTAVTEASANFDWSAFMETLWNDTSDPVGNTLTTGGSPRFNSHQVTASGGLRRRNMSGGQLEVAQEIGFENNNSRFFIPNNQGTARLRMSYTHPLLRGGGRCYNQSLIVLAQVDSNVARDELERQVEGHLLEVTRAYWGLALERAAYLQLVRLFERSTDIRDKLVGRQGLDSYRSQIVRADSAVSSREAALIRAEVAVRNAEARVRALVNDPEFSDEHLIEIIPTDDPIDFEITSDLKEVLLVAMQNRSEIQQSFKQIKAAGVRKEMTKNELLPTLNMVMNSYLSGLQGNSDVTRAWVDQFSVGAPSYGVGFEFDVPVANRAAKARHLRRRLELRQFESQLRLTMETVNLEVGVAVRESNASYKEMQAKYRAMVAASEDAEFVKQRWELLPGDHQNASLVFDDLLRTQQRLTDAENEFLKAQTTYNLSLTNIKKAAGILLEADRVEMTEVQGEHAPQIQFEKSIPAPVDQYEVVPTDQFGLNGQPTESQDGAVDEAPREQRTLTESDFPIPVVEPLNQDESQAPAPVEDSVPGRTFPGLKASRTR